MRGTIALRVSLRSAHVHNRILERLLVIRPCRPLRLQRLLKVTKLASPLFEVLLNRTQLLLERLVFELHDIMRQCGTC